MSDQKRKQKRRRGRARIYPWSTWLALRVFELRRGKDYRTTDDSIAQQVRARASARDLAVHVERLTNGLRFTLSKVAKEA